MSDSRSGIRIVLENLNTVFDLGLSDNSLGDLEKNNLFFLEAGLLAVEMAAKSPPDLNWTGFSRLWWRKIQSARLVEAAPNEVLALAYLAYASKQFGQLALPAEIRVLVTLHRCSFPGCMNQSGLHEDHVWPRSLGGPDFPWNLQSLCGRHNQMKSNFPGLNFCDPTPLRQALKAAFR